MVTFQKAIVWLREGKKIRRDCWETETFWILELNECIYCKGDVARIHLKQIEATDWEIFEEKESEGDLLKRLDIDGHKWAKEFVKIVKEKPEIPTDEGTMIGWFCNSMMAGYDRGMKDANLKEEINPKESLSDQIAKINVVGLLVPYYAYDPNYVKEKIQNAQRRLSELMEEN